MQLIAEKRKVPLETLLKMNHDVSPDALVEGQRLQIPVGELSSRDQEILVGPPLQVPHSQPVRKRYVRQPFTHQLLLQMLPLAFCHMLSELRPDVRIV